MLSTEEQLTQDINKNYEERIMNFINRTTDAVSVIIGGVEYSKEKYGFEIIDGDLIITEK